MSADEEFVDMILDFVDFSTLSERMGKHNSISMDFHGRFHGWTRATFISIEKDADGRQSKVMFTTQIIDEQKKKERQMMLNSRIDGLTKLLNRKAYESDILQLNLDSDSLVYVSVDVNGLKVVNDSKGHEAGDELLSGATQCMRQCFGPYGNIYRVGGDEFVVILNASENELENIKKDFEEVVTSWHGKNVDSLSVSCGYVAIKEFPNASISEIANEADVRMYAQKRAYYENRGVDRRGQYVAHKALCGLYAKIIKINLTDDSFTIINADVSEQTPEKGFSDTISKWFTGFGLTGQVHPDDLEDYLKKTDIDYLKEYFRSGKTSISIFYRRKFKDGFKQAAMEMIPANDYMDENQSLFLYVKNIDH